MKIRRYTIALAFEICLEETRSVDMPDPDHRYEKHVEVWQDRAQEEIFKTGE